MKPLQIKKLFIDFFGKKIEVFGLFAELFRVDSRDWDGKSKIYDLYFYITNPNDVSYYTPTIESEIIDQIDEFAKYVDIRFKATFEILTGRHDLYFNKEKTEEIKNAFKKVDTLKFTTGNLSDYEHYKIKIKSVGYSKDYDLEVRDIYLENIIKPISATKNGIPCDVDDAIFKYYEEFLPQQPNYWETEYLYWNDLNPVLLSIPSIYSDEVMIEYSTELFHK